MPGGHPATQKLVGFWCDPDFLTELDKARAEAQRSQFVRDAVKEKLERMGIKIPKSKTVAPDRTGKGGRPSHKAHYGRPAPAPPKRKPIVHYTPPTGVTLNERKDQ